MKQLAFLFLLTVPLGVAGSPPATKCCVNILLSAEATVTAAGLPHLVVRLTNKSASTLTAYTASLPWGNRYSVILSAVRESSPNEVLPTTFPIDDPGPGTVEIRPAQTVRGDIDLAYFFSELPAALQKDGVIVFWSYRLATVDGGESQRQGGWVRFSRIPPR